MKNTGESFGIMRVKGGSAAMEKNVKPVIAAIDYIETHLQRKLNLETIANGVHYSKYYLHRMFTNTTGLTIQTYVQRRQLTEAARLLVCTDQPILQIALCAGYESQQAFSDVFKSMYKKSPNRYREDESFYPLQLRYVLKETSSSSGDKNCWRERIVCASNDDIPKWMKLVHLVIDGFPHFNEKEYLDKLQDYIKNRRALILKEDDTAIGVMAFHEITGSIDFLGVHPQYRRKGIARAFCQKALQELACSSAISTTTFREGDRADTGYRRILKKIGFAEGELLVEFGYPTQRFILQNDPLEDRFHE